MDWALTAFPKPVNKYVAKPNNNTNVLLFMFLYQTGSAYRPFTQRYKVSLHIIQNKERL